MTNTFPVTSSSLPSHLAQALQLAMQQGIVLDAAAWPALTNAQILAVQQQLARIWVGAAVPLYWKSGGPARTQPLGHAPLPIARVQNSPAAFQTTPFAMRGIEAEIALRLARDISADEALHLQDGDAAGLIDAMAVSVEIVDSRWMQQLQAPDSLKAADFLCHGALALGEWQPYRTVDWAVQRCTVSVGQQTLVERQGSHSLQDPAWLLPQWLRYVTQHYGAVPAGTVVTTGSWCGLLLADAGDTVTATFDDIGVVTVML